MQISVSRANAVFQIRSLAHAEVYHAVAILISRFEITSYDTDRKRDVEVSRDGFIGMPAADSPGIRVRITEQLQV